MYVCVHAHACMCVCMHAHVYLCTPFNSQQIAVFLSNSGPVSYCTLEQINTSICASVLELALINDEGHKFPMLDIPHFPDQGHLFE